MREATSSRVRGIKIMRYIARVLTLIVSCFWIFFVVASLGEKFSLTGLIVTFCFILTFIFISFIVWRRDVLGGILLIVLGLLVLIGYPLTIGQRFPLSTSFYMILTTALPFLVAGALLLICWRRS